MIHLPGRKLRFVPQREVGTTVTVGPCAPIILCIPPAYTGLVAERKWRAERQRYCGCSVRRVLNLTCGSVLVSPFQEVTKEKRRRTDGETQHAHIAVVKLIHTVAPISTYFDIQVQSLYLYFLD